MSVASHTKGRHSHAAVQGRVAQPPAAGAAPRLPDRLRSAARCDLRCDYSATLGVFHSRPPLVRCVSPQGVQLASGGFDPGMWYRASVTPVWVKYWASRRLSSSEALSLDSCSRSAKDAVGRRSVHPPGRFAYRKRQVRSFLVIPSFRRMSVFLNENDDAAKTVIERRRKYAHTYKTIRSGHPGGCANWRAIV